MACSASILLSHSKSRRLKTIVPNACWIIARSKIGSRIQLNLIRFSCEPTQRELLACDYPDGPVELQSILANGQVPT